MNKIWLLCVLFTLQASGELYSQHTDSCLQYKLRIEKELSWKDILLKAKNEHKYIFVDCNVSWCAPCKVMEKEVFSQKMVADFINANFIVVKVQMDSTKGDDLTVKRWYRDARRIRNDYNVAAFPTFLYFSPTGSLVHKGMGRLSSSNFIKLSTDALDTLKQFYPLLTKFKNRECTVENVKYLAITAKAIRETAWFQKIARFYIENLQNAYNDSDLIKKDELEFALEIMPAVNSNDKIFNLFANHGEKIDQILKMPGVSRSTVSGLIARQEINPRIWPNNKPIEQPNWDFLSKLVHDKFHGPFADYSLLDAQERWYSGNGDTANMIKVNINKIEKYGIDTAGLGKSMLNNMIYSLIFKYSTDSSELLKAVSWIEIILKSRSNDPQYLDTYANLLYKLGHVDEAIKIEEKAAMIDPKDAEIEQTLNKMKRGEQTW